MTVEQELLLTLCGQLFRDPGQTLDADPETDWNKLYHIAAGAKLDGILYPIIAKSVARGAPDAEFLNRWKQAVIPRTLRQLSASVYLRRLLSEFAREAIPYVLFKGVVLSDLYPNPESRFSADSDMLVRREHGARAAVVFARNGFVFNEVMSKESVDVWQVPGSLSVEMHYRLWEDYENDETRKLDAMNLTSPETLINLSTSAGEITTMNHTEHLIFQVFHIIKHITFMGTNLRGFLDIALFVGRYIGEIDLERFWGCMEDVGYARFCDSMFGACAEYFGMPRMAARPGSGKDLSDAREFMSDMFALCMKNQADESLNVASMTVYQMFYEESNGRGRTGRLKTWLTMIFPKRETLTYRYAYAKRHAVLLPVAWTHRAFHSLFGRRSGVRGLSNSLKAADEKISLLKDYGLL